MKIKQVTLQNDQSVTFGRFTVLVGPNNVGKSRTLRDIQFYISNPRVVRPIIKELTLDMPSSLNELLTSVGVELIPDPNKLGHFLVFGIGPYAGGGSPNMSINVDQQRAAYQPEQSANLQDILSRYGYFMMSYLDASGRLSAATTTASFNPNASAPANFLQALYKEKETEAELRDIFRKTFGLDIRLDYSGMQSLSLKIADGQFAEIPLDPRDAFKILREYPSLDDQGDGFKSFAGVILSVLLSKGRIILLDEPEAFLHPAQARQLGHWLGKHVMNLQGQLIVATHNASFLSGIVSSGTQVDLYRLNRTGNSTTFARIAPEAVSKLGTSPLLSSQRVLESIFYKGVVVCEADSDRAIYDTVAGSQLQSQDALFVHAHNKESIRFVAELLRNASIPTAAITDIDILNSCDNLKNLLMALTPDTSLDFILQSQKLIAETVNEQSEGEILHSLQGRVAEFLAQLEKGEHSLAGARGALNRIERGITRWDLIKSDGINAFPEKSHEIVRNVIEACAKLGLFIVPVGELEGWMDLGLSHKSKWVVAALERLKANNCPENLKIFIGDVLSFLKV